ncbi:hypothetical protein, partial [Stenotrophomonas maltophilia]|uniref:hypothetical protein n=1 Tax=Stenotrophomonas maltophilia TaxID=40324 RepID=UPI002E761877
ENGSDPILIARYLTDVSTKVDTYQQPQESVRGGAMWVGRTRRKPILGGSMAPSMAPTVLPTHMAPPNQQKASSGF